MILKKILLVDRLYKHDHRVKRWIKKNVTVIEYDNIIYKESNLFFFKLKLISFLIKKKINFISYHPKYFYSFINKYSRLLFLADYILKKKFAIDLIYAIDLESAFIASFIKIKQPNLTLIYDCHELSYERNRKESFYCKNIIKKIEQFCINFSNEIYLVNFRVLQLWKKEYSFELKNIKIKNNNFFRLQANFSEHKKNASICYIGAAVNGRMLNELNQVSEMLQIKVFSIFLGVEPNFTTNSMWKNFYNINKGFQLAVQKNRTVMWCCVDPSCISYSVATPNKFYQGIALGMPIIATKGTYLADIVRKYKIGFVYKDQNSMINIIKRINSKEYFDLAFKVIKFHKEIENGKVVL